jgi:hypothetical protein
MFKSNMILAEHAAHLEDVRNAYRSLILKSERKRMLGRPGCT